jgi:hypothetical protein
VSEEGQVKFHTIREELQTLPCSNKSWILANRNKSKVQQWKWTFPEELRGKGGREKIRNGILTEETGGMR